jgi:3-oxoacyl-[acyl-carrier protein] reductase
MTISLASVLVTGAGSGLGREVAFQLASCSISVVCVDASAEGLDATAAEIRQRGGSVEAFTADVASEAALAAIFAKLADRSPALDGLVTCAGVQNKTRILDLTLDEFNHVIAVNLGGTFMCIQNALRLMIPNKRGRIVTISSDTGKRGGGRVGKAAYGASKGGVIALTRSIARELSTYRGQIRINCVCPGPIDTSMHVGITAEIQSMVENSVPLGRFGTTAEIAAGILFLLSDEASYVYGETLCVDGGVVMD